MEYQNVHIATFISRPNRFIVWCRLNGELIYAHLKNTGRGKEVLVPHALVALVYAPGSTRKTDYDLVAVMKNGRWINIDSQAPNQVAAENVWNKTIELPGLRGELTELKREVTFQDARFDIYGFTDQAQPFFVEVKGVTLEHQGLAAFPDAPTSRGAKHVETLMRAQVAGYQTYLCFIVQMNFVASMTIFEERDPQLFKNIQAAQQVGVQLLAYTCEVTPKSLIVQRPLPIDLQQHFVED